MNGKISTQRDIYALKNENNLITAADQEKCEMFANCSSEVFIADDTEAPTFPI